VIDKEEQNRHPPIPPVVQLAYDAGTEAALARQFR